MKFKGFAYDDGRIVKTAYVDGYDFGDRLLEGVPFICTIDEKGNLKAEFANPDGEYEQDLNQKKWNKQATEYAKENDCFYEDLNLSGEQLELLTEE